MPYEPLHHKYRPQTFKDLVGQETIALTLSNALKQEKIASAYLFTGPRGTGKTSSARILAKSLNCLNSFQPTPDPCGQCEVCMAIAKGSALDVMEIDAASNTGVDNIREIIERSRFAPVQCRYKIYAIDECHMLSVAAFNALLKTLEEPPPKVVFILATTDPQRVLPTIISRCQRFDYRRIPLSEMIAHLKYIAQAENIAIADDAIALIAQIANGGLRDAESLLDQLSLIPEEISIAKVWDLVGAVPEQDLLKLLQAIKDNDSIGILQQCRSLLDRGREPIVVLQNLASFYLNLLIAKTAPQRLDMVAVTETCWQQLCMTAQDWDIALILHGQQHLKAAETQIKQTTQPRLWLEVALLGLLPDAQVSSVQKSVNVKSAKSDRSAVTNVSQSSVPLPTPIVSQDNVSQGNIAKSIPSSTVQPSKFQETSSDEREISAAVNHKDKMSFKTSQNKLDVSDNSGLSSSPTTSKKSSTTNDAVSFQNNKPDTLPVAPQTISTPKQIAQSSPNQLVDKIEQLTPAVTNNAVDNQEIWQKVVSCLKPPTTQALLKQRCSLISFDGVSAIVGIGSANLQKLHQGKIPNIEAAFAQVCQRKVKVQLEVASTSAKNSPKNNSEPKKSTQNTPRSFPEEPPPINKSQTQALVETPVEQAVSPPISHPNIPSLPDRQKDLVTHQPETKTRANTATVDSANYHLANQPPLTPSLPSVKLEENTSISSPLNIEVNFNNDCTDDYLQQAIDSLTQSFEGELVEMDNIADELVQSPEAEINPENPDRPNPDDYDDDW